MSFLVADGFDGLVLVFSAGKTSPRLSDAEVETETGLLTMLSVCPSPSQDKSVSNSSCIGSNLGFFAGSVSSSLVIGSCSTGLWPQDSHKILPVTVVSYSSHSSHFKHFPRNTPLLSFPIVGCFLACYCQPGLRHTRYGFILAEILLSYSNIYTYVNSLVLRAIYVMEHHL